MDGQDGFPNVQGGFPDQQGGLPNVQGGLPGGQGRFPRGQDNFPDGQGGFPRDNMARGNINNNQLHNEGNTSFRGILQQYARLMPMLVVCFLFMVAGIVFAAKFKRKRYFSGYAKP
ncbi:MAG: hypothetical protein HPY74_06510 [Firmicutes bacterium]|nr:hypothetical protein [Bacillota bacterium]